MGPSTAGRVRIRPAPEPWAGEISGEIRCDSPKEANTDPLVQNLPDRRYEDIDSRPFI
jgi:hypothetical protein